MSYPGEEAMVEVDRGVSSAPRGFDDALCRVVIVTPTAVEVAVLPSIRLWSRFLTKMTRRRKATVTVPDSFRKIKSMFEASRASGPLLRPPKNCPYVFICGKHRYQKRIKEEVVPSSSSSLSPTVAVMLAAMEDVAVVESSKDADNDSSSLTEALFLSLTIIRVNKTYSR